jgi:hypothetical protein
MRGILPALGLLAVLPSIAESQAPAGTEFQVNTYTTSTQRLAAAAADANGDFVVVWSSIGQDGSGWGIFGQRFTASGAPRGGEFQVNSYTTNDQYDAVVASDANGNFVVVWQSEGQDGSSIGLFAQRFNASGLREGAEFRVNAFTTGEQFAPAVASDANGNFLVMWTSQFQDGSGSGIFGRRFNSSGVPQGSDFQVNSYTTGTQWFPAVASDANGNFVVVWQSYQDGSEYGIFGRRFNAAGVAQGSEFRVNSYTTYIQNYPAVASDANGDFVVVWLSDRQDGSSIGVFGRRFDALGVPQGSEFRANAYTTNAQFQADVTSDENGNFVVVWTGSGQGDGSGVFGRRFDAAGIPQGGEFRVNTSTPNGQLVPRVSSDPDGDFVVVWESDADGSGLGVFGQRYGDLIFKDGFESGDLTHWSSAMTDGFDLVALGPAAMAGTVAGLGAFVNDTNSLFVQDDTPSAENRYRARFYFDTNGFDPGEAQSHFRTRIFIAFDGTGFRVLTLVLKRQGGAYSIEGRVRLNDGTRADTGFFPITDGPHFFEFDWQRSSAPGATDGSFTLRIDNAIVSTLSTLDNDALPVDFARMGAIAVKTGASGTLFYDQFESRRQRLIGPE